MKILLSIFIALLFSGCFETNALIGKWQAADKRMRIGTIEFTKDKMIFAGASENVTYEVQDKKVFVTGQDGKGTVYEVVDNNTIALQIPMMGQLTYTRVE